jgi:hypothetical protein
MPSTNWSTTVAADVIPTSPWQLAMADSLLAEDEEYAAAHILQLIPACDSPHFDSAVLGLSQRLVLVERCLHWTRAYLTWLIDSLYGRDGLRPNADKLQQYRQGVYGLPHGGWNDTGYYRDQMLIETYCGEKATLWRDGLLSGQPVPLHLLEVPDHRMPDLSYSDHIILQPLFQERHQVPESVRENIIADYVAAKATGISSIPELRQNVRQACLHQALPPTSLEERSVYRFTRIVLDAGDQAALFISLMLKCADDLGQRPQLDAALADHGYVRQEIP